MSGLRADESESLTPQAREVLEAARRVPVAPDQATIERMSRAVLLATSAAGAAGAVSAASGAGKVGGAALSLKLVVASTVAVLAVSGGVLALKLNQPAAPTPAPLATPPQPSPEPAAPIVVEPSQPEPPAPPAQVTVEPPKKAALPSGVQPAVAPPQPKTAAPPPLAPDDAFKRELRLLDEARTQLQARDWPAVLGSIEKHDADFPQGALGAEAEVLRILSLCEVNRVGEALERTKQLQRTAGRSPALLRLAGSCVEP